jgi:hypothetical protein
MNNSRRKRIQEVLDSLSNFRAELEQIRDEEQDSFDNMPESLQEGERGEKSQNAIDNLDNAISELESSEESLQEALE